MSTAIHRRVEACRTGTEPACIARLASGWAVMGDPQVLPGYCLLLPDPVVPHLNAMPADAQAAFLADVARLGQAVLEVTGAVRINYAMFGNLEPALHAHVFPRYDTEPVGTQDCASLGLRLDEGASVRRCGGRRDAVGVARAPPHRRVISGPRSRRPAGVRSSRTRSPSEASGAEHVMPRQT